MAVASSELITTDIGDLKVIFSGNHPLREVFADKGSYIHSHKHYELHYILSGSFRLMTEQTWEIHPGDIILIPPGLLHATSESKHKRLVLTLSLLLGEKQNHSFSEYQYYSMLFGTLREPLIFQSEEIGTYLDSLMNLYANEISLHKRKIILSMLFLRIAEHIVTLYEPPVDKLMSGDFRSDSDRRWLIENYISSNYAVAGSIDGLCIQLNLCRRQTDRMIKRLFGESYQTLIGRRRMEAAELLIRRTDIAFRDIAARVGYESYAGFYLAVKNHFGKTPAQLREERS
jgi:AraC-like DNA-binding protein/quercetin dioxygenase-like cupin family protein